MGRPRKRPKTQEELHAELLAQIEKNQKKLAAMRTLLDLVGAESEPWPPKSAQKRG
jgi:hypothetical protein